MAQQLINIGTAPNSGDGDPGRIAFDKVNDNFTELYTEGSNLRNTRARMAFTAITVAAYTITANELVLGHNIYGVNYPGAVTVTLPDPVDVDPDKIIVINDESGQAGTNNITIQVA